MRIQARLATEADTGDIKDISAALAVEIRPVRGGAVHLAEQHRHDGCESTFFVGTIDEQVVGFAEVLIRDLDASNRLGDVLGYGVLSDARCVGVGEAILDAVVAHCETAGCTGIDAQALPGERETKNFFETFGFKARRLVVHRSLK